MLGIDLPIFAFTHCRDVVVEVSKAGGMGVFGVAGKTPEQLEQELKWIDGHIGGRPYAVDLLLPNKYEKVGRQKLEPEKILPQEQREFVKGILDQAGIPPLPTEDRDRMLQEGLSRLNMTPEEAEELVEVAFKHPVKLLVSALGTPARHLVDRAHALGMKVASLVGAVEHAIHQRDAGVDILVAQGTEAGGHTGKISSMILWPQIIDAMAPMPVLAAGGIGRGSQMAAAMAMGADGVWCGSVWLGTKESELSPTMKEQFFAARAQDAIQTRCLTGKSCRALRSKFTEAWEQPGASATLTMPLQSILVEESMQRMERADAKEYLTYPVGQLVGDMTEETTVRRLVEEMLTEFAEAAARLNSLANAD